MKFLGNFPERSGAANNAPTLRRRLELTDSVRDVYVSMRDKFSSCRALLQLQSPLNRFISFVVVAFSFSLRAG
jgi:hypothetical protein